MLGLELGLKFGIAINYKVGIWARIADLFLLLHNVTAALLYVA